MREIRLGYPAARRIYWIQDNLSAHWTPAIRAFAETSNLELVPTPTYASYLNRIESHFGAISEFVVKNADYLDWDACAHAMAEHIRYRNQPERRAERIARRKPTSSSPPERWSSTSNVAGQGTREGLRRPRKETRPSRSRPR